MVEKIKQQLTHFRWLRVIWDATEAFHEHGGLFLTAAMSFYSFVSLIPLAFVAFQSVTVAVGSSEQAQQFVAELLNQYLLPATTELIIERVQSLAGRGIAGFVGLWWSLILFVWAGVRFFELLQMALNRVWGGSDPRSFWRSKLVSVAVFIGAGLLGLIALLITAAVNAFSTAGWELFEYSPNVLLLITGHVLPFVFSVLVFVLLYKYMPTVLVPWRYAWVTGLLVGVAWELTKQLFTALVVERGIYQSIYGPMTSFVILMVWLYVSAAILLFGAEVGAAWQRDDNRHLRPAQSPREPS